MSASSKSAVAHYWVRHCEHCRPFATVREAYEFLRAGAAAHEMAVEKVTELDGRLLLSRDDLAALDRLGRPERETWLGAVERVFADGELSQRTRSEGSRR